MRRNRKQSAADANGRSALPAHRPHTNNHGRQTAQAGNRAGPLARLARQLGVPFIQGRPTALRRQEAPC